MIKVPAGIALLALLPTNLAIAQTSSAHRSTTHRSTTATKAASGPIASVATNAADNPPGVPRIEGVPKPLYALRYVDTVLGTGELAAPHKYYTVRYTGWLTDGTKFDSSYDHPGQEPITFPYGAHRVIPGWDTGFEAMHVGGKRRLYIPYQLAYGEAGRPPIPPKADLIFDIELVSMSDTPPAELDAPPARPVQPGDPSTQPTGQPQGAAPPSDPTKPTSASPSPSSNSTTPQPNPTPHP